MLTIADIRSINVAIEYLRHVNSCKGEFLGRTFIFPLSFSQSAIFVGKKFTTTTSTCGNALLKWHETQFFILSGLYSERSSRTNYTPLLFLTIRV